MVLWLSEDRSFNKVCDYDDFMAMQETVKKLIELTKGVVNDNLEIKRKIDDVSSVNLRLSEEIVELKQATSHMVCSMDSSKPSVNLDNNVDSKHVNEAISQTSERVYNNSS